MTHQKLPLPPKSFTGRGRTPTATAGKTAISCKPITQENGRAKMGNVIYKETPKKCRELMKQLKSGELTEGDVKEFYSKAQEQTGHARITSASRNRYEGMVALYDMDDEIYIGKSENYDNKGNYDNSDNSLLYVSDCQPAFTFLTSEGCTYSQDEALKQGIYKKEDYGEFERIQDALSQVVADAGKKNFILLTSLFHRTGTQSHWTPGQ